MATVDELKILIKAETKQLRKELDGVNNKLDKTSKSAVKSGKNMTAAFKKVGLGVVAATAVIGKLTQVVAKVGMEFEDLKDSLDVVFGSMKDGDAAMQKVFQFAQTTPFQVETVTKAFIALQSVGIEPTNKMLQTFADTASVSVDQLGVFEALVRTVQRSAAGGLGLEELNMLSDRGIPALKILQEELGLAKDDIATFGKTAQGAKLITDALQEGLSKRFGGAMESKMDNLSTKTSNMTIAFKQFSNEIFESGVGDFLKGLADNITSVVDSATRFMQKFGGRGIGVELTSPEIKKGMGADDILATRKKSAIDNIKILQKAIEDTEAAFDRGASNRGTDKAMENYLEGQGGALKKTISLIRERKQEETDLLKRLLNGGKLVSDQEVKNNLLLGEKHQALGVINKALEKQKGKTDEIAIASKHLADIFAANREEFEKQDISIQDIEKALEGYNSKAEDTVTMADHMKDAIANTAQAFSKEFVDSLMAGESAMESFKNFAKNIVSQIISIFLQMAVVNEILNQVFGLEGANRFSTLSVPNPKAGGGTVQKGAPTMVGERGAEIFVPNTGGTIMNNMNSKNAMGGGSPIIVNQSVNFATGVVPTVRAEVTKMLPQISDVTKGAVLEAAVRGGSFRKGLLGSG